MAEYTIRAMTVTDLMVVGRHRELMFEEAGRPHGAIAAMREPFLAWLRPRLGDGSYLGYALLDGDAVVGGAGLALLDFPPHPLHPADGRRGYLLNVYVEPGHRGRGQARRLVEATYAGARARGVTYLTLHASELGRPVYQRMGWAATDEMSLQLTPNP